LLTRLNEDVSTIVTANYFTVIVVYTSVTSVYHERLWYNLLIS